MRRVAGLALAVTVLAAGCTRERPASTTGQPGTSPNAPGTGEPGTYVYAFNGVGATFRLQGSSGSIDIRNGTGSRLGPPRLSILDAADGEELEAEIEGSSPLGKRDRKTFEVSLGKPMHPRDVGLVVLSFGGEVWGALSPG
jgi:hypothetical protein